MARFFANGPGSLVQRWSLFGANPKSKFFAEVDELNRERLQSHHFAPQQCKDFYKNVDLEPKLRECPLADGVAYWRAFDNCLERFMLYAKERSGSTFCALVRSQLKKCHRTRKDL